MTVVRAPSVDGTRKMDLPATRGLETKRSMLSFPPFLLLDVADWAGEQYGLILSVLKARGKNQKH